MMPFIEAGNTPSASLTPSEWNFSPLVTPASLKYSPLEQQLDPANNFLQVFMNLDKY
jgi:hypothetical protein